MNQTDAPKSVGMEWLDFGGDISGMAIVLAVAVIGLGIFLFTRKNIE